MFWILPLPTKKLKMRRNCNVLPCVILVMLSGFLGFAQETTKYKDVLLNDKPAKLNVETGEITLIDQKAKKDTLKLQDSVTVAKPLVTDSIVSNTNSDFHVVKADETLLDIANRYNTTLTELKRANNLETTLVDEGQTLRVKNFDAITTPVKSEMVVEEPKAFQLETSAEETLNGVTYTKSTTDYHDVLKGQTLYSLAKLYDVTVDKLKQENGLNSNLIITGQQLRIANFDIIQNQGDVSVWTVSKGDTLYGIAKANGVSVQYIKDLNGLESNLIKVGQKLQLK